MGKKANEAAGSPSSPALLPMGEGSFLRKRGSLEKSIPASLFFAVSSNLASLPRK
jgi:hypothetical protein